MRALICIHVEFESVLTIEIGMWKLNDGMVHGMFESSFFFFDLCCLHDGRIVFFEATFSLLNLYMWVYLMYKGGNSLLVTIYNATLSLPWAHGKYGLGWEIYSIRKHISQALKSER